MGDVLKQHPRWQCRRRSTKYKPGQHDMLHPAGRVDRSLAAKDFTSLVARMKLAGSTSKSKFM